MHKICCLRVARAEGSPHAPASRNRDTVWRGSPSRESAGASATSGLLQRRLPSGSRHRPARPADAPAMILPSFRRHQTCDFRKRASSAPRRARRGNSQGLAKSSPYAGPSAGVEVARFFTEDTRLLQAPPFSACPVGWRVGRGGAECAGCNRGARSQYMLLFQCVCWVFQLLARFLNIALVS